jgi:carboxyl-terminal processing protease
VMTVEKNGKGPRSRWLTALGVCAGAVGLAALLGAAMTPPVATPPASATGAAAALQPTDQENYVARRVSDIVAREHYRRAPLDDRLSSLILDRYLDAVDAGRSYFYASDIAEFEKYRYELDDAIKAGDVEPAFVIFRRFQQRSRRSPTSTSRSPSPSTARRNPGPRTRAR